MKPLLIIVPTRNRPENVKRFTESYNNTTSGCSQVVLITDSADSNDYSYTGFIVERDSKPTTSPQKMNRMAKKYFKDGEVISYLGEDVVIETKDFDKEILNRMKGFKYSFLEPNDGFGKSVNPTAWFISAGLYKKIGYLAYPKMFHSYTDYIWGYIARLLGSRYIKADDIMLRHHHHSYYPEIEPDATVKDINSHAHKDKELYFTWEKEFKAGDLSEMKMILMGHEQTKKILQACSWLMNKYTQQHFDIYWLNYGEFYEKLSCGTYVSLDVEQVGGANAWSTYLRQYLLGLEDKYIILGLDDYFLNDVPNMDMYRLLIQNMSDKNVCARLCDTMQFEDIQVDGSLITMGKGSYTVTAQICIWDREVLIEILSQTNSPWNFEIGGTILFNNLGYSTIGTTPQAFNYPDHSVLSPGKWPGLNIEDNNLSDIKELRKHGYL